MNEDDDLVEGHVRRGRSLLVGLLALGLLAALPFLVRSLARDRPADAVAPTEPTGPAAQPPGVAFGLFSGRLVYVAAPEDEGRPRLWTFDLESHAIERGPVVPEIDTLATAGPRRDWLLAIGHDDDGAVGLLVKDAGPDGEAVEIARGDLLSLTPNGLSLLVTDADAGRSPGCLEPAYRLELVSLASLQRTDAYGGPLPCGTVRSATMYGSGTPVVSVSSAGELPRAYVLGPDGPEELFRGYTVSSAGAFLFALERHDLLVWPGGGALRAVVTGSRLIGTILSSSNDGRYLAVDGRIGDATGAWVVDVAAGTARSYARAGYPLLARLEGATFDDAGTLFSAARGRILALTRSSLFPLRLPVGAPSPVGPIAWLP